MKYKKLLPLLFLSLLFYGAMFFLTVTSWDIHNARLPQVTAGRVSSEPFTYTITFEDGTEIERTHNFSALPKALVDSGQIFLLETVTREGLTYYYARRASVIIDKNKSNTDYYAISDGVDHLDTVILTGYETLEDGDEVYVLKEAKEETPKPENIFQ